MKKKKFLKPLFISIGCALLLCVSGSLIFLTQKLDTSNKNQLNANDISYKNASTIFGSENISFDSSGNVTISKFSPQNNETTDTFDTLVLPSKIDGKNVTYSEEFYKELNSYFKKENTQFDGTKIYKVKNLYIGDQKSFEYLRQMINVDSAPSFLVGLENVEVGGNVTKITDGFFRGIKSLKTVTISTSIETIGYQSFDNCTALTDILFTGNNDKIWIDSAAFSNCPNLKNINFANIKKFNYNIAKLPTDKASVVFWNLWWIFRNSGSSENKISISLTSEFKEEIQKIYDYLVEKKQSVTLDNINFILNK